MNRTIKFRAWNPDNENHPMVQNALFRCDARELLNGEGVYKNWTLMQFTGLLDKNGVEIYEFMELDSKWEVDWLDGRHILRDISTGDIIDLNYENKYEITRDYTKV